MGLFNHSSQNLQVEYQPKNGNVHVMTISTQLGFDKNGEELFEYDDQINALLDDMQGKGYEIVDIKFSTYSDNAVSLSHAQTQILYK